MSMPVCAIARDFVASRSLRAMPIEVPCVERKPAVRMGAHDHADHDQQQRHAAVLGAEFTLWRAPEPAGTQCKARMNA